MKPVVLGVAAAGVVAAALAIAYVVTNGPAAERSDTRAAPVAAAVPKAAQGSAPAATGPDPALEKVLADAQRLFNRGDTPAAKDLYNKARAGYRRQNNLAGEASAAFGLGRLEHQNGQSDPARAAYGDALKLYGLVGDPADQARVLVALGDLEKDTFHGPKAAEHYRAARATWAQAAEPKSDAHVMLNLDRVPGMPAGETRARAVLDQADKIFHNIADSEGMGDVALLKGLLEWNLGSISAAQASFSTARGEYSRAGTVGKETDALLRVASAETMQGFNLAAKESLYAAEEIVGDDALGKARLALRRGDVERLQGTLESARAEYDRALPGLAVAHHPEESDAHLRLAELSAYFGDGTMARSEFDVAVAQYRQRADARGEAQALAGLGELALGAGDAEAAKPLLSEAQKKFAAGKDARGEGRALLGLSRAGALQNDADVATNAANAAAERFIKAGIRYGEVLAELAKGDAARAGGSSAAAAAAYREAARVFNTAREPLADASAILGLAPVNQLDLLVPGEFADDENPVDPEVARYAQVTRAANVAAYPQINAEARKLLSDTQARLASAGEFARSN